MTQDTHSSAHPDGSRLMLYERSRKQLLAYIRHAKCEPGQCIGTEKEMAAGLDVSRNTLRRALADLESLGYVTRRPGVGTILARPLESPGSVPDFPEKPALTERVRIGLMLPIWSDTQTGLYTGQFLAEISSSEIAPMFSVQVHRHDDIAGLGRGGTSVVAIDPSPEAVLRLKEIAAAGRRVVVVEPSRPFQDLICIASDPRATAAHAVRQLYAMGHRHVGLLSHDHAHMNHFDVYLGYLDAHRELGRAIHPDAIVQATHYPVSLRPAPPVQPNVRAVTGWVCSFLGAAFRVAEVSRQHDLRIPDDVTIMCFDDPGSLPLPLPLTRDRLMLARHDFQAIAQAVHQLLTGPCEPTPADSRLVPYSPLIQPARAAHG